MQGRVRSDKSVVGTWTRPRPQKAGSFRITPGGILELYGDGTTIIARSTMMPGWNKSL